MAGQPILGHESATEVTATSHAAQTRTSAYAVPLSFHRISSFLRTILTCMILGVDLQPERACLTLNVI
jgi:hypothetical protein